MKKFTGVYMCAIFILPVIVFTLCAGGASSAGRKAEFRDAQGKEWALLEIRSQGKTVGIDRKKLEAGFPGGVFTLNFEEASPGSEGRVNGAGAPNRYFGPYTAGGNNALSIGNLASTKMAALFEPEELKEHEFFDYLSKAKRWDIRSGKLELYSTNSTGAETVLVFETKK
jgi:heat shock protein HslJ